MHALRPAILAGASGAGGNEKGKRDYDKWSVEEEALFFTTLKTAVGQKPEVCLAEISKKLAGSKDYKQVQAAGVRFMDARRIHPQHGALGCAHWLGGSPSKFCSAHFSQCCLARGVEQAFIYMD
jgi:hypothetical protein